MKTLYDLPFPMTDSALLNVPIEEQVEAMLNHACQYHTLHKPLLNMPCSVFRELGIGMDLSNSFVLIDQPNERNGYQYGTTLLTNEQAYRILRMYLARHGGGVS